MVCVGLSERDLILGGPLGGQAKFWGAVPPWHPLSLPLLTGFCKNANAIPISLANEKHLKSKTNPIEAKKYFKLFVYNCS